MLVACALVFAGVALSAGSYSDVRGDNNAAPDITSVGVAEPVMGSIELTIAVGNFQTLPDNSWVNVWFDLDSDPETGDGGDEALVRYLSDGSLAVYVWDGAQLADAPAASVSASFSAGTLTLSLPKSVLGAESSFGILVVSARGQALAEEELIAADYAPGSGRFAFVGPAAAGFTDGASDHDAAPDIGSIRVRDAKDGWVSFAITTSNYARLPVESILSVSIDSDNRRTSGDEGADVRITSRAGEFELQRWHAGTKSWRADDTLTRVRLHNAGSVVTLDVHRSELGTSNRLGFAVVTVDVNPLVGAVVGIDVAPDDASFYTYTYANKAARLLAGTAFGTPARPQAGKPFMVSIPIRRSDTGRRITSGTVSCNVRVGATKVRARGSVGSGAGRCALVVPSKGSVVSGSMIVRSGGTSMTARFSFKVR